jgi:hypothetical protein
MISSSEASTDYMALSQKTVFSLELVKLRIICYNRVWRG